MGQKKSVQMIVRAPSDKSDFEDKLVIDNWGQEIINNITKDAYHGERVMRTVTIKIIWGLSSIMKDLIQSPSKTN